MIESSGKVTPKYASIKLLQIAKPVMFDEYIQKSLMTAIEALEKQIPKKPIFDSMSVYDYFKCPICGIAAHGTYCKNCGQAIDWSDDKEAGEQE